MSNRDEVQKLEQLIYNLNTARANINKQLYSLYLTPKEFTDLTDQYFLLSKQQLNYEDNIRQLVLGALVEYDTGYDADTES